MDMAAATRQAVGMHGPFLQPERFRHALRMAASCLLLLAAGCGTPAPADPDAASPDRLPIIRPFDFSKPGNTIVVDFRVVDSPAFERWDSISIGYFLSVPRDANTGKQDPAIPDTNYEPTIAMRVRLTHMDSSGFKQVPLHTNRLDRQLNWHREPLTADVSHYFSPENIAWTSEQSDGQALELSHSPDLFYFRAIAVNTKPLAPGQYRASVEVIGGQNPFGTFRPKLYIAHINPSK